MNIMREYLQGNQRLPRIGFGLIARWPLLRYLLWFCLFETAFYFAYRYGMSFSQACAAPFWFPDSVLLCALLLTQPRRWWLLVLAVLPIRLFVGFSFHVPLWFLLGAFAIDSAKGLLTAAVLRRFIKNPLRLETVREFGVFCLFAVLLYSGRLGLRRRGPPSCPRLCLLARMGAVVSGKRADPSGRHPGHFLSGPRRSVEDAVAVREALG